MSDHDDDDDDEQLPSSPREVIQYIRREYGIGSNLTGEGARTVRRLRRGYGRLLSTVANELNSEDNHFVLELIQNAQDNKYTNGIEPSISFRVTSDLLVVENNELGFTPENVRSLCSAAESTKKDKTIYIGEKGIGFKSVFKVTNAPEVHSAGFHFRFIHDPSEEGSLSYVLPHWHDPTIPLNDAVTTLVLPAKPGHRFEEFDQLTPRLLLFLSKLRLIAIEQGGTFTRFRRVDQAGVTRLSTTTRRTGTEDAVVEERYVRVSLPVSMEDVAEVRRTGVSESTLVLAFPILKAGGPEVGRPSPVFAFLPVRDYGFRFIIHADFVLTSSRESIQEQLAWNQRLRDCIPVAFLKAVDKFKTTPGLRYSYFHFLPRRGEVKSEFFRTACEQLFAVLRKSECVIGECGRWLRPNQVLRADKAFRDLVPSETLLELFGLDYLHPEFDAPSDLLDDLGCHGLTIGQVCSLFSTHAAWLAKQPVGWKASFYGYLAAVPNRDALTTTLRERACVPLSNGKFALPGSVPVFFPLRAGAEYGFEEELNILHPGIFKRAQELNPATRGLFAAIGVKADDPYEIIHSHILRRHQAPELGGSTDDALIAHLRYVKDRWSDYKAITATRGIQATALRELKQHMYVGTKAKHQADGDWTFDLAAELYVSKEYKPSFSLEDVAGEDIGPELLVSERYVTGDEASSQDSLLSWRTFFSELGINARPRVRRCADGDAECAPEVLRLLRSSKKPVRRALLESFDREWTGYTEFTRFAVTLGRAYASRTTSFVQELRSTVAPTKRRNVFDLSAAYLDCDEVRSFFGENANYLDARFTNTEFLTTCGVTFRVDATACLRRLREARAGVRLSRDQLRHIFNRLEECWKQDQTAIEQAFRVEPLIPISFGDDARWFTSSQVTWRSPPVQVRVLESVAPSLSNRYSEHRHFFSHLLRIQDELPLVKWVDAIAVLPSVEDDSERRRSATAIYQRLASELEKRNQGDVKAQVDSWLPRFRSERLFLTRKGGLVAMSPTLFKGDAIELVTLFEDSAGLSFLDVAPDQLSKVGALLDELRVRGVTESVAWGVAPGTAGTLNQVLTEKVRSIVPLLARVVYSSGYARFKSAIEQQLFERAQRLAVLNVQVLEIDASLAGHVRRTSGDAALDAEHLYLRTGAPAASDQVARELRKLFRLPESAGDVIARLLSCSALEADEYLSVIKKIGPLPAEEERHFQNGALPDESQVQDLEVVNAGATSTPTSATPVIQTQAAPSRQSADIGQESYDIPTLVPKNASATPSPSTKRSASPILGEAERTRTSGLTGGQTSAEGNPPTTSQPGGKANSPTAPNSSTVAPIDSKNRLVPAPHGTEDVTPPVVEKIREAVDSAKSGAADAGRWNVKQKQGQDTSPPSRRSKKRLKRRAGRMVSYAEPREKHNTNAEEEQQRQQRKDAVELAAIRTVKESAEVLSRWPKLTEMPPLNPGFDILAETAEGVTEFIEVKGKSAEWGADGVALTPTELEKASKEGERYWLCVVEHALSASPRLYLVQAPYARTDAFCFDENWKAKALAAVPPLSKPVVGLFVTVPGKGKGRIMSVKGTSTMSRVHIIFENGSQAFKVFEPSKMVLSRE